MTDTTPSDQKQFEEPENQNQDIESPENQQAPENEQPDEPKDLEDEQDYDENEEDDEQDQQESLLDEEVETTVESVIEAILFATDEPMTKGRLTKVAEMASAKQVTEAVKNLNTKYKQNNSAFRIERVAGGYQMLTLTIYNSWLRKMLKVRTDSKLSQAALETLAIIAYKQPIIRADLEVIRGVASGEVIRSLMQKGLVKILGRAEVLGRPLLYGTTKKFLQIFGLNALKDLPNIEELKKPD